MDSRGDCLSITENTRCYGLIVVAAQYNVQYFCFQHLKNVEGVELPSFDDLVKLKHDPGLSSVKRTILGAGHYSEHIARWMRYYNAKQVTCNSSFLEGYFQVPKILAFKTTQCVKNVHVRMSFIPPLPLKKRKKERKKQKLLKHCFRFLLGRLLYPEVIHRVLSVT